MSKQPTCPECGADGVRLDALLEWSGTEWVHWDDCGDCCCVLCEAQFKEDAIKWVVSDE